LNAFITRRSSLALYVFRAARAAYITFIPYILCKLLSASRSKDKRTRLFCRINTILTRRSPRAALSTSPTIQASCMSTTCYGILQRVDSISSETKAIDTIYGKLCYS
jgi:hypothetical protein